MVAAASTDEFFARLKRLYAAVDATKEFDLGKFPPTVTAKGTLIEFYQEFSGGTSDAQVSNVAHTAIFLIAHLESHITSWARRTDRDVTLIKPHLGASEAIKIIIDLANLEKHAGHNRRGTHSGELPRLEDIKRVLRLSTGRSSGSYVRVTLLPTGPAVAGSAGGDAAVVIDADIVGDRSQRFGGLHDTLWQALDDWEALLCRLGGTEVQ